MAGNQQAAVFVDDQVVDVTQLAGTRHAIASVIAASRQRQRVSR